MDRALNPELLGAALGDAPGLPTVAQLVDLLAAAEAGLFRGQEEVDPKLLDTAWYLHTVGSALPALDMYGPARQRQAYQVAGHIFDLALLDPERDRTDRLRFTFAAQVANLRGELNPNAIAAYRWRLDEEGRDVELWDPTIALQLGTALLGGDRHWLFQHLPTLNSAVDRVADEWRLDVRETILAAAALVARGIRDLLVFLVYGDRVRLSNGRARLEQAVRSASSAGDVDSRWVAFHLWQLSDDLGRNSLWSVLPPDTPPEVPRAFTLANPGVLSLWPPQLELLTRPESNPLDPAVRRLLLSLPTSAGKTLIGQVLAAQHLVTSGSGVCFVAPTRSLCREIAGSMRRRLRLLATASEVRFADWTSPDADGAEPRVEVMTPERLAYLLRIDEQSVLARFGMFIIDEVHTIGDSNRGWTLEWAVSTLHRLTRDTQHRLAVMSAALGNRAVLASWLDPEAAGVRFHSDWRGPRRVHGIFTAEVIPGTSRPLPRPRANSPYLVEHDLAGVLRLRPTARGRLTELRMRGPIGRLVLRRPDNTRHNQSTAFYRMLVPLARRLGRAGPVLIIAPRRVEAANIAIQLSGDVEATGPEWLAELAASRLGSTHPLVACISNGVAYHHASLPADILLGIEQELSRGRIHYVAATTTLTEGVNLPVRTVIIAAQGTYGEDGFREYITGARLLNAIGRAGRAAKESEGWVILARNAAFERNDFDRLAPTEEDIPVLSALASGRALEQLADLEDAVRRGHDLALENAGSVADGFISYIWYVCSLADDAGLDRASEVGEHLGSTLAWHQLPSADRRRWVSVANRAVASFGSRAPALRRRWSRAGTSIATSAKIDAIAEEVAGELRASRPATLTTPALLDLVCGADRLDRMLALPEGAIPAIRNRRAGRGVGQVSVDVSGLLANWVAGADMQTLADEFLVGVADPDFRLEQLADYVTAAFDNHLPWVLGLIVAWVNSDLETDETYAGARLPANVTHFVRYGVDSDQAVHLIHGGVASRRLATTVASHYLATTVEEGVSIRDWLCSSDLDDWRALFEASPMELGSLLDFASPRGNRLAAQLLNGQEVTIDLRPADSLQLGLGRLDLINEDAPALGIWVGGLLAARVLPQHAADLQEIHSTGIPVMAELRRVNGVTGTLRLADFSAE